MTKIATPISNLFKNKNYAERIISNSDCLECRDHSIDSEVPGQELFHCDLQPIHDLIEKDFKYLKYVKAKKPHLKLVTFHIGSCCDKPLLKKMMFKRGGKVYTRKEMIKNAEVNINAIKDILGNNIGIALENNNYYPTEAYEYVTDPEFISHVVYENNIRFLFDIAHAKIAAHNKKSDYTKYRDSLPIDRTAQLHISSYGVGKEDGIAYDTHECPVAEDFTEAAYMLSKFPIKYLSIEYYKDAEGLIKSLKKARELI